MAEDIKRMRFFNGLFLTEEEFNLEQNYHQYMRRMHNRSLHGWGIVEGLTVEPGSDKNITVRKGFALDNIELDGQVTGREIVLTNDVKKDLSSFSGKTVLVTIMYKEKECDPNPDKGGEKNIHIQEQAVIEIVADDALVDAKGKIVLAKVNVPASGPCTIVEDYKPRYAGVDVKQIRAGEILLHNDPACDKYGLLYGNDQSVGIKAARIEMNGIATVDNGMHIGGTSAPASGGLIVEGNSSFKRDMEIGTAASKADVTVNGNAAISGDVHVEGKIGVGTIAPAAKLHVKDGDIQIENGNLLVGNNVEIIGNLTVRGNTIALDLQHKAGDMLLGDNDQDKIRIQGILSSNNSSGYLEINDSVHVSEQLFVDDKLHVAFNKTLYGKDVPELIRFGADGKYEIRHSYPGAFKRNTLAVMVDKKDAFGIRSSEDIPLFEVKGDDGDVYFRGAVGIGKSNPLATLDVAGNVHFDIGEGLEFLGDPNYFGDPTDPRSARDARIIRIRDYTNGKNGIPDGGIAIEGYTVGDKVRNHIMAIRGDGKVGIGTKDPRSPLSVAGVIESTKGGFRFPDGTVQTTAGRWQVAGNNIGFSGGYVGIGTNSPAHRLHLIAGDEPDGTTYGIISDVATGAATSVTNSVTCSATTKGNGVVNTLTVAANSYGSGQVMGIDLRVSGEGTGHKSGIISNVRGGTGSKYAGYFLAVGEVGKDNEIHGLNANATCEGSGQAYGIFTSASGTNKGSTYGLYSFASGAKEGPAYGIFTSASGTGTGPQFGIYSSASGGGTNYAGYFQGNVVVTGSLTKGSGSFLIDHPLDPKNKTLRHNFVESPENLCLYRGRVRLDNTGKATVKMPDYFPALTKEEEATVVLTPVGKNAFAASYEWNKSATAFVIHGNADSDVSYIVLADRDDPTMQLLRRPVEEQKGKGNFEKGTLLYPEAYGEKPQEHLPPTGSGAMMNPGFGAQGKDFPDIEELRRKKEAAALGRIDI